jgi:hypothetical protein
MTWTTTPPTEPGTFHWLRRYYLPDFDGDTEGLGGPVMTHLSDWNGGWVYYTGGDCSPATIDPRSLWYGPVTPPPSEPRGGLAAVIGQWPGSETDAQIDAALREMS